MAQNNHDWRIFINHVSSLRRRLSLRRTQTIDAVRTELDAFNDPDAYVRGLSDVLDARSPASQAFQEVERIAATKTKNPDEPWEQHEIDALRRAIASRTVLWNELQRFTAERDRNRRNGVGNADRTSRDWIRRLVDETRNRRQYLEDVLAEVDEEEDGSAGQDQGGDDVADERDEEDVEGEEDDEDEEGEEAEEDEEAEQDEEQQNPVGVPSSAGSAESLPRAGNRRKRRRESDDDVDSNGSQRSKKTSRSNDSPGPVVLEQPMSSNGVPLANLVPFEQEIDHMKEFDLRWQNLREEWKEQDRPTWERLYNRARRLMEANLPAMVPEDLSAATMADFRIKVNTALEEVLGWDWEEHIDIIKADDDGLCQEGDLQRAEMLREASMQRARGGHSPIWPPVRREASPPAPPGPPINFTAQARAKTADAIASDLIWEGDPQQPGEWNYLNTIGSGAHGQAQLWAGVRSDDHGMIVERIIVKYFSIEQIWAKESTWISNSFTGNDTWLRERAMHAQLSSVGSASGIVQYRGATTPAEQNRIQRLYMEYCPHGDLMDLFLAHAKSDGVSSYLDDDDQPIPQVRIPVRALWSFFKDLAAAACIMKSGYNPLHRDIDTPDDWEEIIHRDLKPANIFLAAPLAKTGRGIPVCKVGDFGLTVPREYEPLPNPESMCRAGTPGWKAPEYNPYPEDFEIYHELSSATDIWAIGRIMLSLMELPIKSPPPVVRYDGEDEGHVIVEEKTQLVATYGDELYGLVEKCLERTPGDRIKARDLLRAIDRQLNNPTVRLPLELEEGDVLECTQEIRWAT